MGGKIWKLSTLGPKLPQAPHYRATGTINLEVIVVLPSVRRTRLLGFAPRTELSHFGNLSRFKGNISNHVTSTCTRRTSPSLGFLFAPRVVMLFPGNPRYTQPAEDVQLLYQNGLSATEIFTVQCASVCGPDRSCVGRHHGQTGSRTYWIYVLPSFSGPSA